MKRILELVKNKSEFVKATLEFMKTKSELVKRILELKGQKPGLFLEKATNY